MRGESSIGKLVCLYWRTDAMDAVGINNPRLWGGERMTKRVRQDDVLSVKLLLAALAFGDALVGNTADHAAENRGDPEEPELLDGSAANEHGHSGRASRVHGGVGHRDRDEVDEREAETDSNRGKACRSATVGGTHDHEQEDRRKHGFNQECGEHARGLAAKGIQAVGERVGPAVGGEGADTCVGEVGAGDRIEECRRDDAADDLGDDVGRGFLSGEAAAGNLAERDRRVQVAARNVADGVGHGKHRKAKRERHAHVTDTGGRDAACEHSCAAAAKHKPEGADRFGNSASSKFHLNFSILWVKSRALI